MSDPPVQLTGLGIPESPRWHQGRLPRTGEILPFPVSVPGAGRPRP